jgi:hypothetical protein
MKNNDFTTYILFAFSLIWWYLAVLSSTQTPPLNSSSNFKHNFRHWLVLQMGHFIIPQNFLWTKTISVCNYQKCTLDTNLLIWWSLS